MFGFNFADLFIRALLLVPALLIAIPVHEIGHALAAYWLGDKSVRYFGYLKPDPRRYLDPYGAIAVFLAIVGWGRRVPIQSNRITTTGQKVIYQLGGPGANLAVAIVVGIVFRVVSPVTGFDYLPGLGLIGAAIYAIVFLNLSVFAFNLLPIPGLDGWNVIEALFRRRNPRFFYDVAMRQREIWVGAIIAVVVFNFVFGISLLSIVMSPFFEPASLISLNGCADYRIPNIAFLFPCLL